MPSLSKALSEVQLSVMNALWQIEQGSVSEVLAAMKDTGYARTTVATLLTRLEKQDYVAVKKVHGVNVYYPLVAEQEVRQSSISQLLKNFFGDRKTNLVSFLLDENVSEQELQQVRELLDEKQQKNQF